ncbi:hypothetical protein [Halomonas sp.]|uniref:hypothetical protein n=1 Tax=Halomonas sp. TaxID=1486246 RepID=UPI0035662FEB
MRRHLVTLLALLCLHVAGAQAAERAGISSTASHLARPSTCAGVEGDNNAHEISLGMSWYF